MNSVQARVGNLGTCRPDAKGDVQVEDPQGLEYRCRAQGRNDPYERGNGVMLVEQRGRVSHVVALHQPESPGGM